MHTAPGLLSSFLSHRKEFCLQPYLTRNKIHGRSIILGGQTEGNDVCKQKNYNIVYTNNWVNKLQNAKSASKNDKLSPSPSSTGLR